MYSNTSYFYERPKKTSTPWVFLFLKFLWMLVLTEATIPVSLFIASDYSRGLITYPYLISIGGSDEKI